MIDMGYGGIGIVPWVRMDFSNEGLQSMRGAGGW